MSVQSIVRHKPRQACLDLAGTVNEHVLDRFSLDDRSQRVNAPLERKGCKSVYPSSMSLWFLENQRSSCGGERPLLRGRRCTCSSQTFDGFSLARLLRECWQRRLAQSLGRLCCIDTDEKASSFSTDGIIDVDIKCIAQTQPAPASPPPCPVQGS